MMVVSFKDLVFNYGRDGDTDSMEKLTHKIDWFVEKVKEKDPELVSHFLMKVDLLLNPCFTKETAEYAVSCMENKDGTKGEHWTYSDTTDVLKDLGYDFNEADWYYVLNMMYSDYYKSGRSDDTYFELAHDFLDDKDAPEGKAKRYYLAMHQ